MWQSRWRKVFVVCLLCGWFFPSLASAQLAVADAPVLAAVGSVLTTLKSIYDQTMTSLEELANWSQVVQRLQLLAQLTTDLEALATEITEIDEGWSQLSDSGQALCSIEEAVEWKGQSLQWQHKAFGVARKANRLLGRSLAVLVDVQMVVNSIVGPTSGSQSSSAILAVIASGVAQLHGLTSSFNTASLGKDVIQSVIGIQLVCIHQKDYVHWGSYSR